MIKVFLTFQNLSFRHFSIRFSNLSFKCFPNWSFKWFSDFSFKCYLRFEFQMWFSNVFQIWVSNTIFSRRSWGGACPLQRDPILVFSFSHSLRFCQKCLHWRLAPPPQREIVDPPLVFKCFSDLSFKCLSKLTLYKYQFETHLEHHLKNLYKHHIEIVFQADLQHQSETPLQTPTIKEFLLGFTNRL